MNNKIGKSDFQFLIHKLEELNIEARSLRGKVFEIDGEILGHEGYTIEAEVLKVNTMNGEVEILFRSPYDESERIDHINVMEIVNT